MSNLPYNHFRREIIFLSIIAFRQMQLYPPFNYYVNTCLKNCIEIPCFSDVNMMKNNENYDCKCFVYNDISDILTLNPSYYATCDNKNIQEINEGYVEYLTTWACVMAGILLCLTFFLWMEHDKKIPFEENMNAEDYLKKEKINISKICYNCLANALLIFLIQACFSYFENTHDFKEKYTCPKNCFYEEILGTCMCYFDNSYDAFIETTATLKETENYKTYLKYCNESVNMLVYCFIIESVFLIFYFIALLKKRYNFSYQKISDENIINENI